MYATYPAVPSYGKTGNYLDCLTSAGQTSWTGTIAPGDYNIRIQAVKDSGPVILAQTDVVRLAVPVPATQDLGALVPNDNGDGKWTFTWTAYSGVPFSYYKLVYEQWDSPKDPSYPGGSAYWAVPGTADTSVKLTVGDNGFLPGHYKVRIQAIGYPGGSAPRGMTWTAVALNEAVTVFPSSSRSSSRDWRVT